MKNAIYTTTSRISSIPINYAKTYYCTDTGAVYSDINGVRILLYSGVLSPSSTVPLSAVSTQIPNGYSGGPYSYKKLMEKKPRYKYELWALTVGTGMTEDGAVVNLSRSLDEALLETVDGEFSYSHLQ